METKILKACHGETVEIVDVIKVKRLLGVRYIVFWKDNPEPTVYTTREFISKFVSSES